MDEGYQGGQLLELLYVKKATGNPVVQAMYTRLLFECHKVLLHQVNAWVVHGQLIDLCEEFFIHRMEADAGKGAHQEAAADDGRSVMNKTVVSQLSGFSSLNAVNSLLQVYERGHQNDENWSANYTLRHSMLAPSCISVDVAQKILFIGKAVMILQSQRTPIQERIPADELQAFSEALTHL